jgi:hypothetical protein
MKTIGPRTLKFAVLEKFITQRAFLESLKTGTHPLHISESRFSKILTGNLVARRDEARAFSRKLQMKIRDLFPEMDCLGGNGNG